MAGLAGLLFHFVMVLLFTNPFSAQPPALANRYVYPWFRQGWSLFVPTPVSNYRLFVDFSCHGRQRYDLFENLVLSHRNNRFRGGETILTVFASSIHYFEHATPLRAPLNGPVTSDPNFKMLVHSTKIYLEQKHGCEISDLKLILVVLPFDKPRRVYFN